MSDVIQISDFQKGEYRIPTTSFQEDSLQEYIDKYERHYLIRLFGRELYDLFIADLVSGVPQTQRFVDVFNETTFQDDCDFCDSYGIKEMLKGFIYFHYVRHTFTRNTTNGVKQTKSENSDSLQNVSSDLVSRHNGSVRILKCIQRIMCDDATLYPEYKGIIVEPILIL